jgi:ubiquinone/menaquinone biosynthesis C-methylase UbiE
MQNPLIDGDFVYDVNALPLPSGSVDEVFSDYVQERVVLPRVSAVEISRVLRPGGLYLSSTPD